MTDAAAAEARPGQETKDLYELGEIPPLGHVPGRMYAELVRGRRGGMARVGPEQPGRVAPRRGRPVSAAAIAGSVQRPLTTRIRHFMSLCW